MGLVSIIERSGSQVNPWLDLFIPLGLGDGTDPGEGGSKVDIVSSDRSSDGGSQDSVREVKCIWPDSGNDGSDVSIIVWTDIGLRSRDDGSDGATEGWR